MKHDATGGTSTTGRQTRRQPGRVSRRKLARATIRLRKQAPELLAKYPSDADLSRLPAALADLVRLHKSALQRIADPHATPKSVVETLAQVGQATNDYQASDDSASDASDCTTGCMEALQDCLESWTEIETGENVETYEGEEDDGGADGDGGVGGLDDNPMDVENETSSEEDDDTTFIDAWDSLGIVTQVAIVGLCDFTYIICLTACLLGEAPS